MITLWRFAWSSYLEAEETVVKVISWRTALVDGKGGQRRRVTVCPLRTWILQAKNWRDGVNYRVRDDR